MPTITIDQSLSNAVSIALSLAAFIFTIIRWRIDENRRADEAQRWQANKIAAWLEGTDAIVVNSSDLPIYGAAIVIERGPWAYSGNRETVTPAYHPGFIAVCQFIPPGKWRVPIPNSEGCCGCGTYPAVKIGFVSSNGTSWIRDSRGSLSEIGTDPFVYFGLTAPFPFTEIQQAD
jgi:hypothetical protein